MKNSNFLKNSAIILIKNPFIVFTLIALNIISSLFTRANILVALITSLLYLCAFCGFYGMLYQCIYLQKIRLGDFGKYFKNFILKYVLLGIIVALIYYVINIPVAAGKAYVGEAVYKILRFLVNVIYIYAFIYVFPLLYVKRVKIFEIFESNFKYLKAHFFQNIKVVPFIFLQNIGIFAREGNYPVTIIQFFLVPAITLFVFCCVVHLLKDSEEIPFKEI